MNSVVDLERTHGILRNPFIDADVAGYRLANKRSARKRTSGESDLAEAISLAEAVATWVLDPAHQAAAILTPEHPLTLNRVTIAFFSGKGVAALAERIPPTSPAVQRHMR